MRKIASCSRSLVSLVALNTALVFVAVGAGSFAYVLNGKPLLDANSTVGVASAQTQPEHVGTILAGNFRVVGRLLAGACTLGALTTLTLLWNAFGLGYGVSALAQTVPGAVPLILRYAPLEFSAFVLVASVAEHLVSKVLRCLAANEPLQLWGATLTLVLAAALLTAAAIVEADVVRAVATPHS